MSDIFTSVVLVTFPSEVQYDNWLTKFRTFYNKKAIEFLRNNKIFGSPTFVVNSEIFWGDDRMEDAIAWSKTNE